MLQLFIPSLIPGQSPPPLEGLFLDALLSRIGLGLETTESPAGTKATLEAPSTEAFLTYGPISKAETHNPTMNDEDGAVSLVLSNLIPVTVPQPPASTCDSTREPTITFRSLHLTESPRDEGQEETAQRDEPLPALMTIGPLGIQPVVWEKDERVAEGSPIGTKPRQREEDPLPSPSPSHGHKNLHNLPSEEPRLPVPPPLTLAPPEDLSQLSVQAKDNAPTIFDPRSFESVQAEEVKSDIPGPALHLPAERTSDLPADPPSSSASAKEKSVPQVRLKEVPNDGPLLEEVQGRSHGFIRIPPSTRGNEGYGPPSVEVMIQKIEQDDTGPVAAKDRDIDLKLPFHPSRTSEPQAASEANASHEGPPSSTSEALEARLEHLSEPSVQRRDQTMLVRLRVGREGPILLELREEGSRVSATIRTEDRAILYLMQTERESLARSLAEKGVPLHVSIEVKRDLPRKEERREKRSSTDRIAQKKGG